MLWEVQQITLKDLKIHRVTLRTISKARPNKSSNNYLLIIKNEIDLRTFVIQINSKDAKNISLAKNNIFSDRLKTYELFLNLISIMKIKILKINIRKKAGLVSSQLILKLDNELKKIECSFVDSIVISYMTISQIFINENLFNDIDGGNFDNKKYYSQLDTINKNRSSKLKMLNSSLSQLIKDENYESAAIIRDKILQLSKKK